MVRKLSEILGAEHDIVFAFLFGSYQKGDRTSSSDLDMAIYFISSGDFYRLSDLKDQISRISGLEVDIVVLNHATPVIKMQVLKKGALLVNKNPRVYHDFVIRAVNEYDDLKMTRKEIEDHILRGRIYA